MAPFKEGSLKIAEKAGCPIIPMAITHTRDIIKDHIPFVKPTHVTIQYGTPVYPNELPKEEKNVLWDVIHRISFRKCWTMKKPKLIASGSFLSYSSQAFTNCLHYPWKIP